MNLRTDDSGCVEVVRGTANSAVIFVCEHASPFIPARFNDLGIAPAAKQSHIAWDPGAMAVARAMADNLGAVLVASKVSRLVYDCNRPPVAADAMPIRSEAFDVPGNVGLTQAAKDARVAQFYTPFKDTLAHEIAQRSGPVIVTIHSFTPIYNGQARDVEIGVLHDGDSRLADAILDVADTFDVRRNAPYGPEDGVTHTLKEHAIKHGHLNVMIEVRNDLIADEQSQTVMAQTLTRWISQAIDAMEAAACKG